MCLTRQTMPRKSRILLALGNLCMFSGLIMSRFTQQNTNWRHFASGFLLGLAITFLFAALYKSRNTPNRM